VVGWVGGWGWGAIPNPLCLKGGCVLGGREEPATRNAGMHERWPPLANGAPTLA
jgi:hypothetical protein